MAEIMMQQGRRMLGLKSFMLTMTRKMSQSEVVQTKICMTPFFFFWHATRALLTSILFVVPLVKSIYKYHYLV
jgi:hypothetical protein